MAKIGIFGGTFNPIHNGHIEIAKIAMKESNLDKVIFVPTKISPNKKNSFNIETSFHRYEMTKKAVEDIKEFEVSDYEISKNKV